MLRKRSVNTCTGLIRNFFVRLCCVKRFHVMLIAASVMVSTFCLLVLSQPENHYNDGPQYQQRRNLPLQDAGFFQAFFQYSGNISYQNVGVLRNKVFETRQYIPPVTETPRKDITQNHQQGYSVEYKSNFLDSINVSAIPLNRTAFGSTYNLSETRSKMYDFPYIINCNAMCKTSEDPFLVIMVLSVHTHIDTRSAIRNTWGRAASPGLWPKVGNLKQKVKLVFLFGMASNELGNNIVKEESKMHGDVVQANFVDSYFNLTYKTITGIRWVAEFCPNAKYILKADEDVFVHVHNLLGFLSKREKKKHGVIFGHTLMRSNVFREGRWAVSTHAYPLSLYPAYTCGNTYVISRNMAAHIFYTAGLLPYLNIEDVFVTGIVRTFLNGELVDVPGFTHWFEKRPVPCEFKNAIRISATKVTDFMQYAIFEGLKTKEEDCYKQVQTRHVKTSRPELRVINSQIVRDEHIFMNKSNGKFYKV